ncbi:MAG: hypothetical protein AAFN10_17085 [Bacteroidota bacterium]
MPAKAKYLSSGWRRTSKVLAATLGAYATTMFIHSALAKVAPDDTPVLLTATFTGFFLWVGFMIMVYMIEKAWISWTILLSLCGLSALLIFL